MTQPQPSLPRFSALQVDLFSLPGIGDYMRKWNGLLLANSTTLREAKTIMFGELAEATRRGIPLDAALSMSAQTLGESVMPPRLGVPQGADTRGELLKTLFSLFLFVFSNAGLIFYTVLAMRYIDAERVARLLAMRLLKHVEKGRTLSDAMAACGLDYDRQEVEIIRAAEQWSTLPKGLQSLSDYQATEGRLVSWGSHYLYPLMMGLLLLHIIVFIYVVIIPKFADIYAQLGAELPGPTQFVVGFSSAATRGFGLLLLYPAILLGLLLIIRAMMNGNVISRLLLVLPMLSFFGCLLAPIMLPAIAAAFMLISSTLDLSFDGGAHALVVLAYFAVLILPLPWVMATVERLILRMERFSARLVQYLPILGAAARAEREARWLAALTLALESGVTAPDAVRSAGLVCGGRIEMRSEAASASVAKGLRIGAACREHHVLSRNTLQRLAFLDGSNDFVAGVRLISEDTTFDALSTMARAAKVAELVGMLFLGTVMGFFALSVYLPLFYISRNIRFEL